MATCTVCTEYLCSDKGMIMPFVNEYAWSKEMRIVIYILCLIWCLLGVNSFSGVLMQGIEAIIGKVNKVTVPDHESETGYSEIEIKVWNDIFANLILIAFGSSVPETALSFSALVSNDFKVDDIGPSSLVCSAAFKFIFVTGICVLRTESEKGKIIFKFKVFLVTAIFSVVAYSWLFVILFVITPDYVDVWEAIVTILFYPLMLLIAYIVDKDFFGEKRVQDSGLDMGEEHFLLEKQKADRHIIQAMLRKLQIEKYVKEEDIGRLTAKLIEEKREHSRAWYRINASQFLTGGSNLIQQINERTEELLRTLKAREEMGSQVSLSREGEKTAIIEFTARSTSIMQSDKRVKIGIARHGDINRRVRYRVETFDGTAVALKDYIEVKQSLVFEPGETMNYIEIDIVDDAIWEEDEIFFARISIDPSESGVVGRSAITQIVFTDDVKDTVRFPEPSFVFKESVGTALVPVERKGRCKDKVTVKYDTKDLVAVRYRDYSIDEKQEIVFEKGEVSKMIEIGIYDDMEFEKEEKFEVRLTGVEGDCELDKRKTRCVVAIVNDDEFIEFVARVTDITNDKLDSNRMIYTSWRKQFRNALNVNGGDIENAKIRDYVLHLLTFGWKIISAFIPPPCMLEGCACFGFALIAILILTTIIGDLANILGCLIGLKPGFTIIFISVGTSMPDLIASIQAAKIEPRYADKSIGYLAGYNAANVLMGLGVPWTCSAIYWAKQGQNFEVKVDNFIFDTVLYSVCAIITLLVIVLRRYLGIFGKTELGGPINSRYASGIFLILLSLCFVVMSTLRTYEKIPDF